ncbi:Hypothetical predicted protein [Pelobates cultripes]|uniref:Uncharacterized protein n=1 Tax=Pelobates cultripes TaxID=61616 RepID=A0AAD1VN04_PELCU|nr:Hypothetical predicted protein [Pelobates cultripes]
MSWLVSEPRSHTHLPRTSTLHLSLHEDTVLERNTPATTVGSITHADTHVHANGTFVHMNATYPMQKEELHTYERQLTLMFMRTLLTYTAY